MDPAKSLYVMVIQCFCKVVSNIAHVRQHNIDHLAYIGRIVSLKDEPMSLLLHITSAEDQQTQNDKLFIMLTIVGLCPNLNHVKYQILASLSEPLLDVVFARMLCISSTQNYKT